MDVSKMIHRLKTYQNGVHGDFFLEVADLLTSLMAEKEPSAQSPAAMAGSTTLAVNLNQKCRIKLMDRGIDVYNKYYADLGMEPPKELRSGDIYEDQLWEIMNIFGAACYMGPTAPFETTIEILGKW